MVRRAYPDAPVAAVGAIILDEQGRKVLLIRRGNEPQRGAWSIPGGAVELGESLEQAVCREVLEETNLSVKPLGMVETLDRILLDSEGRVQYHYVLVDFACQALTDGNLLCATDALEARWILEEELDSDEYALAPVTTGVIRKALLMTKTEPR